MPTTATKTSPFADEADHKGDGCAPFPQVSVTSPSVSSWPVFWMPTTPASMAKAMRQSIDAEAL
ncbi:hypothetical protein SCLCIDRAFT_1214986, partial [Scleroderma citrinum Foug A]